MAFIKSSQAKHQTTGKGKKGTTMTIEDEDDENILDTDGDDNQYTINM